jgi:hypothetical protein
MKPYFRYPLNYHGVTTLYFFQKGEYEQALIESEKIPPRSTFWSPLHRIAILGQLGRCKEAKQPINVLKELNPNFCDSADRLVRQFIYDSRVAGLFMESLAKVGLDIANQ